MAATTLSPPFSAQPPAVDDRFRIYFGPSKSRHPRGQTQPRNGKPKVDSTPHKPWVPIGEILERRDPVQPESAQQPVCDVRAGSSSAAPITIDSEDSDSDSEAELPDLMTLFGRGAQESTPDGTPAAHPFHDSSSSKATDEATDQVTDKVTHNGGVSHSEQTREMSRQASKSSGPCADERDGVSVIDFAYLSSKALCPPTDTTSAHNSHLPDMTLGLEPDTTLTDCSSSPTHEEDGGSCEEQIASINQPPFEQRKRARSPSRPPSVDSIVQVGGQPSDGRSTKRQKLSGASGGSISSDADSDTDFDAGPDTDSDADFDASLVRGIMATYHHTKKERSIQDEDIPYGPLPDPPPRAISRKKAGARRFKRTSRPHRQHSSAQPDAQLAALRLRRLRRRLPQKEQKVQKVQRMPGNMRPSSVLSPKVSTAERDTTQYGSSGHGAPFTTGRCIVAEVTLRPISEGHSFLNATIQVNGDDEDPSYGRLITLVEDVLGHPSKMEGIAVKPLTLGTYLLTGVLRRSHDMMVQASDSDDGSTTGSDGNLSDHDDGDEEFIDQCAYGRRNRRWEPLEEQRLLAYRRERKPWRWIFTKFPDRTEGAVRLRWSMLQKLREAVDEERTVLGTPLPISRSGRLRRAPKYLADYETA